MPQTSDVAKPNLITLARQQTLKYSPLRSTHPKNADFEDIQLETENLESLPLPLIQR